LCGPCFLSPMLAALCLSKSPVSCQILATTIYPRCKICHFFRNFTDSLTFSFLFSFFTLDVFSRSECTKNFSLLFLNCLDTSCSFFSGSCLSIAAGYLSLLPGLFSPGASEKKNAPWKKYPFCLERKILFFCRMRTRERTSQ
jgi:hypothetical protein